MVYLIQIKWLLALTFVLFVHGPVFAADETKIYFHPERITLQPGETKTLTLLVEKVPPVYGVQLGFSFDPNIVEVITNADETKSGIQLENGSFLNHKKQLTLQNTADNTTGMVNYTKTLLNPASPAQGSGELLRITFKGKQVGTADFRITNAKFGTQEGTVIVPDYQNEIDMLVSDSFVDTVKRNNLLFIAALILLFLITGSYFLHRRKKNRNSLIGAV